MDTFREQPPGFKRVFIRGGSFVDFGLVQYLALTVDARGDLVVRDECADLALHGEHVIHAKRVRHLTQVHDAERGAVLNQRPAPDAVVEGLHVIVQVEVQLQLRP